MDRIKELICERRFEEAFETIKECTAEMCEHDSMVFIAKQICFFYDVTLRRYCSAITEFVCKYCSIEVVRMICKDIKTKRIIEQCVDFYASSKILTTKESRINLVYIIDHIDKAIDLCELFPELNERDLVLLRPSSTVLKAYVADLSPKDTVEFLEESISVLPKNFVAKTALDIISEDPSLSERTIAIVLRYFKETKKIIDGWILIKMILKLDSNYEDLALDLISKCSTFKFSNERVNKRRKYYDVPIEIMSIVRELSLKGFSEDTHIEIYMNTLLKNEICFDEYYCMLVNGGKSPELLDRALRRYRFVGAIKRTDNGIVTINPKNLALKGHCTFKLEAFDNKDRNGKEIVFSDDSTVSFEIGKIKGISHTFVHQIEIQSFYDDENAQSVMT